jgi:guanylate kinase
MAPVSNLDLTPRVVYGPSGVGKGTIINAARSAYPNIIGHSVSHTTRQPRPGEEDGYHYHFVDEETFKKLISEGAFIEHAIFNNTRYGTSFAAVKAVQDQGKLCILDIEIEGVKQVRVHPDFTAKFLYLAPPSREELRSRLTGRGTENEKQIANRLKQAEVEMEYAEAEGANDERIVNDDLEKAKDQFREWLGLSLPEEKQE